MSSSRSLWYWNRLRAMRLGEVARRARRAGRHAMGLPSPHPLAALVFDATPRAFPALPEREQAPERVVTAAADGLEGVMAGRWRAFDALALDLDYPPRWQRDYLGGVDLATSAPGTRLDPRRPPPGTDIRVIWELSRWHPLLLLARAARVLDRHDAAEASLLWLEDWQSANPPFTGWNWTSALETGLRLIDLAWIDALLRSAVADEAGRSRLGVVMTALAPAHVWFTWRERSFGSSANNHLLGELAGLLVAAARWPALTAAAAAPLDAIARAFEREVLAQFAPDGGNREQALRYHLFALEVAWLAIRALEAAGRPAAPAVVERLGRAGEFYAAVQVERDPWDYGDSDDAAATRFLVARDDPRLEWRSWLRGEAGGEALRYWLGEPPRSVSPSAAVICDPVSGWTVFSDSGIAMRRSDFWIARFDASPLGYLSTAAHGHLDALHLSLWLDGVAVVIDPGTGAYYADSFLRELLASRRAHNGPCPIGLDRPRRRGAFLWSEHHPKPSLSIGAGASLEAALATAPGAVRRSVHWSDVERSWRVVDRAERGLDFWVRWQLAPGSAIERSGERAWRVTRGDARFTIAAAGPWSEVETGAAPASPSFRSIVDAPFVALRAGPAADSGELQTLFRRCV